MSGAEDETFRRLTWTAEALNIDFSTRVLMLSWQHFYP